MSRKTYTTNVGQFPANRPIPVLEPNVKTGTGKTTFKTATAAANAAREARDEARALTNECASYLQQAAKAKEAASFYCESTYRRLKFDFWWKLAIMSLVTYDLFVRLTT